MRRRRRRHLTSSRLDPKETTIVLTENETSLLATVTALARPTPAPARQRAFDLLAEQADGVEVEFHRLNRAHTALTEILARLDTKALAIKIPLFASPAVASVQAKSASSRRARC